MASKKNEVRVQFLADTADFRKQVTQANSTITELSSELKLNSEQMRTMGETAELAAQRQQILERMAVAYADKQEALNKELEVANKLYGENSVEASKLRTQINNAATAANKLEPSIEGVNDGLEDTDKAAKDAGDELGVMDVAAGNLVANGLTALASGLKNAATEFIGLAEETREYRTEQAKLDTAFQTAGWSADTAKNTYMELYAVLGEEDRSVEAANHLAQLANTQEDLTDWTKICAGVFATFGDSLPIEGLTEAANETAKVGDVTGVLADALNWAGVNEEDFQAALDDCNTEQERAAKITETLNGLYGEAADAFYESNESVIEANRVNAEYTDTLADLGEMVEPLSTTFKKGFGNILKSVDNPQMESAIDNLNDSFEDMFNDLSDIAEEAGPAFVEIVGFAARNIKDLAIVIPTAVIAFKSLKTVLAAAKAEQIAFSAALAANPVTAVIGGISALVSVFGLLSTAINETRQADEQLIALEQQYAEATELSEALNTRISAYNDLKTAAQENTKTDMAQLNWVRDLSAELLTLADSTGQVEEADRTRAQFILGELNTALGTEYQLTGNQIENYEELTGSIYDLINAKTVEAIMNEREGLRLETIKALQDEKDAYFDLVEASNEAQGAVRDAQAEYDNALRKLAQAPEGSKEENYWLGQVTQTKRALDIAKETAQETQEAVILSMIRQSDLNRDLATDMEIYAAAQEGNYQRVIDLYAGVDAAVLDSEKNLSDSQVQRRADLEDMILDLEEYGEAEANEWLSIGAAGPSSWTEGENSTKGEAVGAAKNFSNDVVRAISDVGRRFKSTGETGPIEFGKGVNSKKQQAIDATSRFNTDVKKKLAGIDTYAEKQGEGVPTKFGAAVEAQKSVATDATANLDSDIKFSISDLEAYFESVGLKLPPEFRDGLLAMMSEATGAAQKLGANTKRFLSGTGLYSGGYNEGANLALGMKQGIADYSVAVSTGAAALAAGAVIAAKRAIQSNSPSKLAAREVGEPIPQGVAVGIEEDAHLAEEAAEEQAQSVIEAYSKGMKDLDPYIFGGMKAVLPPETFKGMKAKLPELPQISGALETAVNAKLADDRLIQAIEALANRPVYLDVNGRRFAVLTAHDADMVNGSRQILRDRGLSI